MASVLWANDGPGKEQPCLRGKAWLTLGYPFAVKVATGKVCAVTGEQWANHLNQDPRDYLVLPKQPCLTERSASVINLLKRLMSAFGYKQTSRR